MRSAQVFTVLQTILVTGFAVTAWIIAPASGDRIAVTVITVVWIIGIVAASGGHHRASRLPDALQGVLVGSTLATFATVAALGQVRLWGWVAALIVLPSLYPKTVPARIRPIVTLRWSDLRATAPTRTDLRT